MNNMNNNLNSLMQTLASQQVQQQQQPNKTITYFELLSLLLVAIKGFGFIDCSWIVPFIPVIIPLVFYGIVLLVGFIKMKYFSK